LKGLRQLTGHAIFFKITETMRNIFLNLIATLTILTLIYGCNKDYLINDINDDNTITTIAGTWKVVSYDDFSNDTQIKKDADNTWTEYNSGDVTITFKDTLPAGQMHGLTVTNEVFASYTLSNPRIINIENFLGTQINQPDWADLFWENIMKAEEYEVNSTQLRIFYNSKKNSITFEKV
jgi:hypothetical protein